MVKNPELEKKLQEASAAPAIEKKKVGRPVGWRKNPEAGSDTEPKPKAQPENILPAVNEVEAVMFAGMLAGISNMFVKKDYRDKLKFTTEEFLNVTRPATQLKAYYAPNFGGIYVVWTQFATAGIALGVQKANIIKEIIKKDKDARGITDTVTDTVANKPVTLDAEIKSDVGTGKENNPGNGDKGNGKVD